MNENHCEVFSDNPAYTGLARMRPPVRYSQAHEDCVLYFMEPWKKPEGREARLPLIVFVQGSGWTHPDVYYELAQLCAYAQKGYAVASVAHRSALDGFPFPAYLQDVKTAVRYLRAHAEAYAIDPARVCVWGTSSGGNTALLAGVTMGDARYETGEWAGVSSDVKAVISCFGPTDLPEMIDLNKARGLKVFDALTRGRDAMEVGREMSPVSHLRPGICYPPTLFIHGDADDVVPFAQSAKMHEALLALKQDSTLIRVARARHEENTWSPALHARIRRFLKEKL